eukprot:1723770-Pyramimonas_sp.AAC.1
MLLLTSIDARGQIDAPPGAPWVLPTGGARPPAERRLVLLTVACEGTGVLIDAADDDDDEEEEEDEEEEGEEKRRRIRRMMRRRTRDEEEAEEEEQEEEEEEAKIQDQDTPLPRETREAGRPIMSTAVHSIAIRGDRGSPCEEDRGSA